MAKRRRQRRGSGLGNSPLAPVALEVCLTGCGECGVPSVDDLPPDLLAALFGDPVGGQRPGPTGRDPLAGARRAWRGPDGSPWVSHGSPAG